MMKWLSTFVLVGIFVTTVFGANKTLTVGIVLRSKNKFDTTILRYNEGIETAKRLFESEHPGIKITLKSFPHDESLKSVADSANQVIANKVPAVIGPEYSTEAVVMAEKLDTKQIVAITPTATLPELTLNRPYMFRVCFSDEQVADGLAHFVISKLKPSRLGVFKNISIPYSKYLSTEFVKRVEYYAKALNIKAPQITETEIISGSSNLGEVVAKLKGEKNTVLTSFVMDSDFSEFVSSAGRQSFFPIYIGSDSWGTNEYVTKRYIKESPYGKEFFAYRNYYWKEDSESFLIRKFRTLFKPVYKNEPNAFNAIAFDAAWTLFTAMARVKNPNDGELIRKSLKQIKNLELITANRFSFGNNNSPVKDLFIYKIDQNGPHYEETIR